MDASELVAREMIRDLVAAYAHAADRGRFGEVAALFTEDGVLELPDDRRLVGRRAIVTFLTDTARSLADTAGRSALRHHVSGHRVLMQGADAAVGYAYFLVVGGAGPDHWGRYADRYVRDGGRWLLASRRVRVDGRAAPVA
jgi:ketosteroid isomerase-like protein